MTYHHRHHHHHCHRHRQCDHVKRQINTGAFEDCSDVNVIANLLKVWFR